MHVLLPVGAQLSHFCAPVVSARHVNMAVVFTLAFVLAAGFLRTVDCEDNGLGLFPPLGWNSWCTWASCGQKGASGKMHDVCNETEIRSVAEAMLSNGMHALGYEYINLGESKTKRRPMSSNQYVIILKKIDDCWGSEERAEVELLRR